MKVYKVVDTDHKSNYYAADGWAEMAEWLKDNNENVVSVELTLSEVKQI